MRSRILALVFFLVLFFSFPAWAQTFQLFNSPHQQFLDTSGRPLAGGQIFTYAAGTTTPQTTYKDSGGTTPNTNPVVLDSGGFGTIYLNTAQAYKVVLKNAQGVQQWSVDNIAGTTGTLSTVPLNSILPATGTNTIDNGNNAQVWRWALTGATNAFTFGETSAGAGTGALLTVNGLSNAVTPLDVESAAASQVHFGYAPTTGGWLSGINNSSQISGGANFTSAAGWAARSASASILTLNSGSVPGGFTFTGDTGKTVGTTFTPTVLETIAPLANGASNHVLYATGLPINHIYSGLHALQVTGTATFDGTTWTARDTTSSSVALNASNVNFYGNLGLTPGNAFTPTLMGTISPAAGLTNIVGVTTTGAVNAGSVNSTGNVHGGTLQADNLAIAPTYLLNDATGKIVPCPAPCAVPTGGPAPALSAITQALANNTLANSSFTQTWNWVLTGANNGMVIGEGSAGAGTGALVQINGLSNAVTALDVRNPVSSQIHFGANATGGWLSHSPSFGSAFSHNATFVNGNWTAANTTPIIFALTGGGFSFFADTGKTPGSTFTPTTLETIAPSSGGALIQNLYSQGNLISTLFTNPSNTMLLGQNTYDSVNFTARATSASGIQMFGGGVSFFGDTGKTVGATYTPTGLGGFNTGGISTPLALTVGGNTTTGSLNVTTNSTTIGTETVGRVAVQSGVAGTGYAGLKHQRFTSCTTTAVANGSCTGNITWNAPAFADANYTVTCTFEAIGGNAFFGLIFSKVAAGFSYAIYNVPGSSAAGSGNIHCVAMHD